MKKALLFITLVFLISCSSKTKTDKEIENIPIDLEIIRFDKSFGEATVEDLPHLKNNFPNFFPQRYHDSIWVNKMHDTLQQQLYVEVKTKYPNEDNLKKELDFLFQHIKYYFPQIVSPTIITTTSDVDYRNKVIISDSLLIIALDTYLGDDHFFYEGIPKYIRQNLKEEQIISDVSTVYAQMLIPRLHERTFLAQMLYYGKILYLKDLWMTQNEDSVKIGYTEEEYAWVQENEIEIWRNFVENEYLFSTNTKLASRFINPAPFSKFYLEIDNDSPGRVGRYLGWQIVKSYMENNEVSISKMITMSADEIFNNSKYKPKK